MRIYIRKNTEMLCVTRTELKFNALRSQQNMQERVNKMSNL